MQLSGLQEPFICVRFCPVLFNLHDESTKENACVGSHVDGCFGLPYRVVFAVATITSVVVYASEVRLNHSCCVFLLDEIFTHTYYFC